MTQGQCQKYPGRKIRMTKKGLALEFLVRTFFDTSLYFTSLVDNLDEKWPLDISNARPKPQIGH